MEFDQLSLSMLAVAATVALLHTAAGPDHYVPFVMMSRARKWSRRKTLLITAVCGVGHVSSSIVLGGIGIAVGAAIGSVESWEGHRGDLAAWGLVAFGLAYALWGLRVGLRAKRGYAIHTHGGAHGHVHIHAGGGHGHGHAHGDGGSASMTFWVLFTIFVFGPCEPLIPIFVVPVSEGRWDVAIASAVVFSLVTIVTMLVITATAIAGLAQLRSGFLERWMHSLSGSVIAASGLAILYLGL